MIKKNWQKALFIIRFRYVSKWIKYIRKLYYLIQGMYIGAGSSIARIYVTWPNQVKIGTKTIIEHDVYFKFDGIWSKGPSIIIGNGVFVGSGCEFNISGGIKIGNLAMIASGCRFVDHDHGTSIKEVMNYQRAVVKEINVEEEVWIGANCVILKGVTIGRGAVIGAGSVVNKNVEAYQIFGGVPATFIKNRT